MRRRNCPRTKPALIAKIGSFGAPPTSLSTFGRACTDKAACQVSCPWPIWLWKSVKGLKSMQNRAPLKISKAGLGAKTWFCELGQFSTNRHETWQSYVPRLAKRMTFLEHVHSSNTVDEIVKKPKPAARNRQVEIVQKLPNISVGGLLNWRTPICIRFCYLYGGVK